MFLSALRSFDARLFLSAILLVLGGVCSTAPAIAQDAPSDGTVVDEIVAVVEDNVILRSEIAGQVQAILQQQRQQGGRVPPRDQLWEDVLQSRIDQHVLAAHARRDTTIQVSDSQVQQYLDRRIEQLAQRAGGRQRLEQAYGMSINELKANFEDQVREQLLAQKLQQQRFREVRITPREVREWFADLPQDSLPTIPASVRLSHIVRYPEPSASAQRQAREVIGALRDSVLAGVPIEELARRYSDDAGTAPQGGRMQSTLSDLVPSFAAVASRAPIGEVSRVFESPFGYHILRVNERSGDEVDFNHILIEVDESTASGDEARAYLSAVRDSIVNEGMPFGLMARRHSEEERSAEQGGSVTDPQTGQRSLHLDRLGPSWKSTLSELDEGEVSQPREVRLIGPQQRRAIHIVRLEERVPQHRVNLQQDYTRLKELALQEKQRRIYQKWVDELRKDVYIDLRARTGNLAADAR